MKWVECFPMKALALAAIALEKLAHRTPFSYAHRARSAIFWELLCRQVEEDERAEVVRACRVNCATRGAA
jgi:hypothetical protein